MKQNYKVIGEKPVGIVVEMGLGSCLSEWMPFARGYMKEADRECSILLYERAGIHKSSPSVSERTPENIARELFELLEQIEHLERIVLIGHSQGGMYAAEFCHLYPEMVRKLILLDPLSAQDNQFKELLTPEEYKKSGVDKSLSFAIMRKFAKCKLGWITKSVLKKAPPFCYYDGFSKEEQKEILETAESVIHNTTVLEEYAKSHEESCIRHLQEQGDFPDIPLILVTHSSETAIAENMKFGGNSREFAVKVEDMWQQLMKSYLDFSKKSQWIQAERSGHYIHLQEPELISRILEEE